MTAADDGDAATSPAEALGELWEVLDSLPRAATSPDLLATTVEMAAVSAPAAFPPSAWTAARSWLTGAAVVLGSLVAGLAVGRATAPQTESALLANLPVVQHVDLLRELGSVGFLEEVSKRDYSGPRRLPPTRSPADARADDEEFDAAMVALKALDAAPPDTATLAARRQEVLALSDMARRQLERSAERFQRLSAADRRDLVTLGRTLADPARGELVDAARLWHRWVQLRDPADRQDVVDLGTADRLECLDRWTRFDLPRGDGREGMRQWFERDRDLRRPPNFRPGAPPGQPGDFRPGEPRGNAPDPRPGGPGFRPGGPGFRPIPPEPRPADPPPQGDPSTGPEPSQPAAAPAPGGSGGPAAQDLSAPGTRPAGETQAAPR